MDQPTGAPTAHAPGEAADRAPAPGSAPDKGERQFTQTEMEAIIRDRLSRQKAQLDAKAEQETRAAREREQAEQGQYRQLAEQRETELTTLRPAAERATKLEALIAQHIDTLLPTLPEPIRALLPAQLPVEDRYAWLIAAQSQAAKLAPGGAVPPGHGASPRPAQPPDRAATLQQTKEETRRTGFYGF